MSVPVPCIGVNSRNGEDLRKTEVGAVKAVLLIDLLDLGITRRSEFDIDALFAPSMLAK